jgi:hypothetical protein
MKVDPTLSLPGASQASTPRPAAEGFRGMLDVISAGGRTVSSPVGSAASATSVAGVGALFALQGAGGDDVRALALRKGRRLLDALDRLQVALLGDGPTLANLQSLQGALAESRGQTGDAELDDTLAWAEVRAAVEAAKLSR